MTLLDILLTLPLLFFIFMGWKKGLVREVATLAGVLLGVWASVHLSQQVAPLLGLDGESAVLIAFIVTFLVALMLTYLLGRCIEGLMKAAKLSLLNRLAGALLGAAKALCILAVLLNFLVMIDSNEMILKPAVKEKSVLYQPVFSTGNWLTTHLKEYIVENKETLKEVVK
ncbi:MAG: CvpA family protein [Bacteroidales bacterium]|nr:CvpA family protein [Bacteroidales bacterium]